MSLEKNINKEHVDLILDDFINYGGLDGIQQSVLQIGYPDRYSTFLLLSILSEWAFLEDSKLEELEILRNSDDPSFEQLLRMSFGMVNEKMSEHFGVEDKVSIGYISFFCPKLDIKDHEFIGELSFEFESGNIDLSTYIHDLNRHDDWKQDESKTEFKRALNVAEEWVDYDESMSALFLDYSLLRLSLINNLNYIEYEKGTKVNSKLRKKVLRIVKQSIDINEDIVYQPKEEFGMPVEQENTSLVPMIPGSSLEEEDDRLNAEEAKKVQAEYVTKLTTLGDKISKRVYGQDESLEMIVSSLRSKDFGIEEEGKAQGFLMYGPTGVGKTETALALQEILYPKIPLKRINCGDYTMEFDIKKLTGSPPGYVGYHEGGEVSNFVFKYGGLGIILFDEIEKAHPSITNYLLALLDTTEMTDNQQNKFNISNLIVLMTSNIGNDSITLGKKAIGFEADQEGNTARLKNKIKNDTFSAPLRGRTTFLEYNSLSKETINQIYDREFKLIWNRVYEKQFYDLEITKSAKEKMLSECQTLEYGARDVKNTLKMHLKTWVTKLDEIGIQPKNAVLELDYSSGEFQYIVKTPRDIKQLL